MGEDEDVADEEIVSLDDMEKVPVVEDDGMVDREGVEDGVCKPVADTITLADGVEDALTEEDAVAVLDVEGVRNSEEVADGEMFEVIDVGRDALDAWNVVGGGEGDRKVVGVRGIDGVTVCERASSDMSEKHAKRSYGDAVAEALAKAYCD